MISASCAPPVMDLVIRHWVLSASEEDISQRRTHLRYPFVRAAAITQGDRTLKALSRDISPRGIGLLHQEPLDLGPTTVSVSLGKRTIVIEMSITWIGPDDGGWRLSGGRFSKVSSLKYSSLILSTFTHELERRFHARYPFFQPVSLVEGPAQCVEERAFSLDISEGGMGLLVSRPFPIHREIHLQTRSQIGTQIDIGGRVVSCREMVNGSYVIGAKFVPFNVSSRF